MADEVGVCEASKSMLENERTEERVGKTGVVRGLGVDGMSGCKCLRTCPLGWSEWMDGNGVQMLSAHTDREVLTLLFVAEV